MNRFSYWIALDLACAAARRRHAAAAGNPAVRRAAIAAARNYLEQARASRLCGAAPGGPFALQWWELELEAALAAPWQPEPEPARPA